MEKNGTFRFSFALSDICLPSVHRYCIALCALYDYVLVKRSYLCPPQRLPYSNNYHRRVCVSIPYEGRAFQAFELQTTQDCGGR
jgi:hypothetical protein